MDVQNILLYYCEILSHSQAQYMIINIPFRKVAGIWGFFSKRLLQEHPTIKIHLQTNSYCSMLKYNSNVNKWDDSRWYSRMRSIIHVCRINKTISYHTLQIASHMQCIFFLNMHICVILSLSKTTHFQNIPRVWYETIHRYMSKFELCTSKNITFKVYLCSMTSHISANRGIVLYPSPQCQHPSIYKSSQSSCNGNIRNCLQHSPHCSGLKLKRALRATKTAGMLKNITYEEKLGEIYPGEG